MRKRFREHGADNFHDHELLEMMLYQCYPRCDTNPIAHKILREFGSLQNLFETNPDAIKKRLNCSENVAVYLSLISGVTKRYLSSKWKEKPTLSGHEIAGEYAISLFFGEQVECFYVLCLDKQNRLNRAVKAASGTIDEVSIFVREIVRHVMENHAAYVILAHNHPGGTTLPSHEDRMLTTQIKDALKVVHVEVVDHIVVGGEKYYSFARRKDPQVVGY